MLDTAAINRLLLPPKTTPPPWMSVRVNWKHPLARGLVVVSLPVKTLANIAQPALPTSATGTATFAPGVPGVGSVHAGTFRYVLSVPKVVGPETGYTVFSHATNNSISGAGKNSIDSDDTVSNRVFQLITATNPVFITFTAGGSANLTTSGVTLTSADTAAGMTISGKIDSTALVPHVTVNGTRTTGSSQASAKLISQGAGISVGALLLSPATQIWPGNIHLSLVWMRALLHEEEDLLHRDPYCIFEPDEYGAFSKARSEAGGVFSATDPVEALSGAASVAGGAALAATDPVETVSGTVAVPSTAAFAATDPVETLSGVAALASRATLAATDPVETLSATVVMSGDLIHGRVTDPIERLNGDARVTGVGTAAPAVEVTNRLLHPPRLTNDPAKDLPALSRWCSTLHDHLVGTYNVLGQMTTLVRAVQAEYGDQTNVATEFMRVLSLVEQQQRTLTALIQNQE